MQSHSWHLSAAVELIWVINYFWITLRGYSNWKLRIHRLSNTVFIRYPTSTFCLFWSHRSRFEAILLFFSHTKIYFSPFLVSWYQVTPNDQDRNLIGWSALGPLLYGAHISTSHTSRFEAILLFFSNTKIYFCPFLVSWYQVTP